MVAGQGPRKSEAISSKRHVTMKFFLTPFSMFSTPIRALPPNIAQALRKLLPKDLPPSLTGRPGNLYEVLSRTPDGGVGKEVYQMRWSNKQIEDSYWKVTRTKFKCEGKHGKAWGMLYWKGQGSILFIYARLCSSRCIQENLSVCKRRRSEAV